MGKGRLVFKIVGGPEVYPVMEQMKALKAGAVDILETAASYTTGDFYEALPLNGGLAGPTAAELRNAGMIKALDRMARQKLGVTLLGSHTGYFLFSLFLTKPIKSINDLKRMKLRSNPTYNLLFQELGVPTVSMAPGDMYTALETGVVDGVAQMGLALFGFGIEKLVKYQVYPDFWRATGMVQFANAAWYDSLPDWARKTMDDLFLRMEKDITELYIKAQEEETRQYRAFGIQAITIPESEWWEVQRIIYESMGNAIRKNSSPENVEEMLKYMKMFYPPKEVWYPPFDWR